MEGPYIISGLTFERINIVGAGTHGINVKRSASGSATFNYVTVSGAQSGGLNKESGSFYYQHGPRELRLVSIREIQQKLIDTY